MAEKEWANGDTPICDPHTTPSERWAIFSRYPFHHKITTSFDKGFYSTIGYEAMASFLYSKQNITEAKLQHINTTAISTFLSSQKIH
jgi:hypothetical protein